jgi:hypothetical protein
MISDFLDTVYGWLVDITPGSFLEVMLFPLFDLAWYLLGMVGL